MARMILSIVSFPYSLNQFAAIGLVVSVTDAQGAPYMGLLEANFNVFWFTMGTDVPLAGFSVQDMSAATPAMPGVYMLDVRAKWGKWVAPNVWTQNFLVAVHHGNDHGQLLYYPPGETYP